METLLAKKMDAGTQGGLLLGAVKKTPNTSHLTDAEQTVVRCLRIRALMARLAGMKGSGVEFDAREKVFRYGDFEADVCSGATRQVVSSEEEEDRSRRENGYTRSTYAIVDVDG